MQFYAPQFFLQIVLTLAHYFTGAERVKCAALKIQANTDARRLRKMQMLLPVTRYPLPRTQRRGSGVSQSVNNAHFNFSPLRCHRTRLQWKRVGPNWRARICANKKFGKQSWRHKTATHCSWNSTRGKLTAEPKIVGNGAKTEPQVLSGI